MKLENFPQEIYVTINESGTEDEYKQVHEKAEDAAEIGEQINVGHYVLKESVIVSSEVKTTVT